MEIRLARHGRHIAIVTIDNQPRLNAMTRAMLAELGRLWDELQRDDTCRAIVLTGAGTRAFRVGADIAGDLSAGPEIAPMVNHALLKIDAYAKPIIAAVNGDCVAAASNRDDLRARAYPRGAGTGTRRQGARRPAFRRGRRRVPREAPAAL